MNTEALDFIVTNTTSGNAIAAFMLPSDAINFVRFLRTQHHRRVVYDVTNKDGSPISRHFAIALDRVNAE